MKFPGNEAAKVWPVDTNPQKCLRRVHGADSGVSGIAYAGPSHFQTRLILASQKPRSIGARHGRKTGGIAWGLLDNMSRESAGYPISSRN